MKFACPYCGKLIDFNDQIINTDILFHCNECKEDSKLVIVPISPIGGKNPGWWCHQCQEQKSPYKVTYQERCGDCMCPVEWKENIQ